jgi:hypothetical protein
VLARGTVTIPPSAPTDTELRRVAAEQEWPRLRVWQSEYFDWWWQVDDPSGCPVDRGAADTQPEALAVGLAALEAASMAGSRP